jgi:hypothetical protein
LTKILLKYEFKKACVNATSSYTTEEKSLCKLGLATYKFPVMSMILSPSGTVVHTMNANDLLAQAHEESDKLVTMLMSPIDNERMRDPVSYVYHRFLNEAIEKAKTTTNSA